jgi:hypothetical protein
MQAPKWGEPIPLFTLDELKDAFALLLAEDEARDLARKWFQTFTDKNNIDGSGRYLYRDWRSHPDTPSSARNQPSVVFELPTAGTASVSGMYDWLLSASREDLESRLLGFSNFHFDLLAVSSPELRARVKLVRRADPHIDTERRCKELHSVLLQRRQ